MARKSGGLRQIKSLFNSPQLKCLKTARSPSDPQIRVLTTQIRVSPQARAINAWWLYEKEQCGALAVSSSDRSVTVWTWGTAVYSEDDLARVAPAKAHSFANSPESRRYISGEKISLYTYIWEFV